VDTLQAALREIDKREAPISNIHPFIVRETVRAAVEGEQE